MKTYSRNAHHASFWVELSNPLAIGLILFPFLISGVCMYLSGRAEKEMAAILKQHAEDLKARSSKGKS